MWAFGCCAVFAACGDRALLQDANGRYRVTARIPATDGVDAISDALAAHVNAHGAPALVFAHATDVAQVAAQLRASVGKTPLDYRIVAIGAVPDNDSDSGGPIDVVVLDETGATVAIDMALLACSGITPPGKLPLGTRILTPANRAKGGTPRPAAGDLIVEMLRRQHATILAIPPTTDVVFRIGLVQWRASDDWHQRVCNEARVAAKRYRQLDLDVRTADGQLPRQDAIVREFLAEGCRAILVTTDDPNSIASVAAEVNAHKAALIVLDRLLTGEHATCSIGADQTILGRAVGETIAQLLPNGGTIVQLHGDLFSVIQQRRHEGFVDALGLK